MRRKSMQPMSIGELIQSAMHSEEMRQQRNARRRARRLWLKTASREVTALRYHAEEKPCPIALYLEAERFVLRWLDEFPELQGDAVAILLTLAHTILHLLHPEVGCTGTTLADCPAFSIHDLCSTALEIGFNFNPDPAFKLTRSQITGAMIGLTHGVDRERLRFNILLGEISLDL